MKPKRTLSAYVLLVGILGLSVIGGVLIYGIYSSLVKTQITTGQAVLIKPIDGVIDTKILDDLQTRRKFETRELSEEILPIVTPSLLTAPAAPVEASPGATTNQP